MKKKSKKITLISICFICLIIIFCGGLWINNQKKEIFSATYFFGLGSRSVKIYNNGDVYDDLEIEDPRHIENYKFLKKLSKEELDSVKQKIQNTSYGSELKEYVIELVYGVKKFDNFGGY